MQKIILFALTVLLIFCSCKQEPVRQPLELWHNQPAGLWKEALPPGKGFTGAMVFGGVSTEQYGLNDNRTQSFPKVELKAKELPDSNNLWVFMLAGQSNMAGRGLVQPQDTVPDERILTINKAGEIIIAKEPLHFYEPSMTGLDCGLSFSKLLTERLPDSISVLIIPTAVGGSSISQWLGDSLHRDVKLLSNFSEKVETGKKYGQIKGVLWHQGESDANQVDIPLYKDRLSDLFSEFRKIISREDLPILIGELGSFSKNYDDWMKINDQISLYALNDSNAIVISTSDLTHKGDMVHFDSESQRILGKRFAEAYLKIIK